MRRLLIGTATFVVFALALGQQTSAQSLSLSLFERYLEALRVEAGIPGLSATVLQNGVTIWEQSFGRQDLEANVPAQLTTPYIIGDVSEGLVATLVLKKCVAESYGELSDRVVRWAPQFPEPLTTIRQVLTHDVPGVGYQYDPLRFSVMSAVVEECARKPYRQVLVEDVFERLGMADSSPMASINALTATDREALGAARLSHYAALLGRLATPYRVDARTRQTTRLPLAARAADTSAGVVSSVRDLARFDRELTRGFLDVPLRTASWTQATPLPTGLGWFVQAYNGEPIVWQFGMVKDAYSSLILKVPNRGLTLILLANSDGLSGPFALERGDVTSSLFARLFLRLLVV